MKIQNVSDLHLEFADIEIKNAGADVLILSGDICVAHTLEAPDSSSLAYKRNIFNRFFERVSKEFDQVLYVSGNHEHYHGRFDKTISILRENMPSNIEMLDNSTFVYQGVTFFGSTLWTDFDNNNPTAMQIVQYGLNDYRIVKNCVEDTYRKLIPQDTYNYHKNALKLIETFKPDVVIGHHGPTKQSIDSRYISGDWSALNPGYVSELTDFILANQNIKLWTHGHTHSSHEYLVGNTRIICNPRGYHDENTSFDANKIWEIK